MGFALNIKCPYCEQDGEHKVMRTDPHRYFRSDAPAVGLEIQNLEYRARTRECVHCRRTFSTVEMLEDTLKLLFDALFEAGSTNRRLTKQLESWAECTRRQVLSSKAVSFYQLFSNIFGERLTDTDANRIAALSDADLEEIVSVGESSIQGARDDVRATILERFGIEASARTLEPVSNAECLSFMKHPSRTRPIRKIWNKHSREWNRLG